MIIKRDKRKYAPKDYKPLIKLEVLGYTCKNCTFFESLGRNGCKSSTRNITSKNYIGCNSFEMVHRAFDEWSLL
jgi:hypothetical protein